MKLSDMMSRTSDVEIYDAEQPATSRHSTENHDGHHEGMDDDGLAGSGLSYTEKKSLFMLFTLYFVHDIPLCFSWLTMPVLLRQVSTYSGVGTFLVTSYPYSIKIIWSPVVETFHLPIMGRRKSWIVPCFVIGGGILFWLGLGQDRLITRIGQGESFAMAELVIAWLLLMIVAATLRIALDAWALDLLAQPNVHWASTAVTIGDVSGCFIAFNLFLGLSSFGSAKTTSDGQQPEASTQFLFCALAVTFVAVAFMTLVSQKDSTEPKTKRTIRGTYTLIWKIVKLPQVWTLMLVHLTSMIGFQTNDSITVLQLVKNDFTDRDIAGLATVSFPFEVLCGIMISRTFTTSHPLHVWRRLFPYRLIVALISQVGVLVVSMNRDSHYRWFIAVVPYCLSKYMETAMFVALVAFHAQVSDPRYGGIYMPLLATTLNIRYDTMQFLFTKTIGLIDGHEELGRTKPLIDGYQIINLASVLLAFPVFWFFLKPATMYLQTIDPLLWRVSDDGESKEYEMVSTRDDSHGREDEPER